MPRITNDAGHLETEAEIKKLEKEIRKEYQKAAKEVEDKLNKYMSSFSAKDEIKKKQVADKILTQEEYDKWRIGQLAVGKRWEEMKDSLASDLANTSEIARSITRGYIPDVYALNHNYATFQVEKSSLLDTSYTLYDRQTVERLFRDKPKLMPPMSAKTAEKIRQGKLVKWNEQKIQSSVMQGILQGESIPKIARRMRDVTDMNYKASIRNARTSITSAQNGGRMDAYHRAEDMGIHQKKQWLATLDDRTRHEHVDLDGQRRELDEPFEAGGYEIMFPGDPDADPAMVYNCRCTMVTAFDGYEKDVTDFELSEDNNLGDMTYDEWKKEHGTQKKEEPDFKVVQGKDISDTWVRRPDKFDFEIEDVINAQGFDGVPNVVSADDFDKAVKESNFIAQRTYSAPDQETLDAYQQQLYSGKWYVDCSVGESHYGQGMYCTATNGDSVNDSIRNTMSKYIERNVERITDYGDLQIDAKSTVETFTVTPDAKFISHDDLRKLKEKEITELSSSGNYDKMNEIFNMDNGSYATMKGYDGITGVYNFVSKDNDDVIILNRTKVIFKKGGRS